MTVKELIEMLETCDKESIVYINCGDDINSIDEICDYSNNCGEVIIVKELIDKLKEFDEDKLVLVEDTEYKEFQAIDVEPVDDRFVIITTTIK